MCAYGDDMSRFVTGMDRGVVVGKLLRRSMMDGSVISRVALSLAVALAAATSACSDDEPSDTTESSGLSPGGATAAAGSTGQAGSGPSGSSGSAGAPTAAGGSSGEAPPVPTGIDPGTDDGEDGASAGAADAGAEGPVVADAGAPPDDTTFNPCPTDGSPCRIMPLGDSITDGLVGIAPGNTQGSNGGYRVELFRQAIADGHAVTFVGTSPTTGFGGGPNGPAEVDGQPFPRDHEGISGDTIPGVAGRVNAALAATTPDIILLQIGTNHIYQGLPPEVPGQLEDLLDQITDAAPDALLVVAQITPVGASFPNNGVQQYNAAIPAAVQERVDAGKHLLLVDNFTPIATDPAGVAALVGDNIHPNETGYAIMAATWYDAIESFLP
jgi:lysophospholipase L1-like esterase